MLAAMFPGVGGGLGWNYYWPAHPPSGRRVFRRHPAAAALRLPRPVKPASVGGNARSLT